MAGIGGNGGRGKRRDARHPCRIGIYIDEATDATLRRASDKHGVSMGTIARCALERGLPAELEARRRKR